MTEKSIGVKIDKFLTNSNHDIDELQKFIEEIMDKNKQNTGPTIESFIHHLRHRSKYRITTLEKMMLIFKHCEPAYKTNIKIFKKKMINLNIVTIDILDLFLNEECDIRIDIKMISLMHFILNIDQRTRIMMLKNWVDLDTKLHSRFMITIMFKNFHTMVKNVCWCNPGIKLLIRNETIKLDSLSEIVFPELKHTMKKE